MEKTCYRAVSLVIKRRLSCCLTDEMQGRVGYRGWRLLCQIDSGGSRTFTLLRGVFYVSCTCLLVFLFSFLPSFFAIDACCTLSDGKHEIKMKTTVPLRRRSLVSYSRFCHLQPLPLLCTRWLGLDAVAVRSFVQAVNTLQEKEALWPLFPCSTQRGDWRKNRGLPRHTVP